MLAEHIDVLRILYFEMDEACLIARLKGRALKENRADDAKEDVIRKRIQVYEESTKPVLEKYAADIVTRLNASQSMLAVARDVFASLADVLPN